MTFMNAPMKRVRVSCPGNKCARDTRAFLNTAAMAGIVRAWGRCEDIIGIFDRVKFYDCVFGGRRFLFARLDEEGGGGFLCCFWPRVNEVVTYSKTDSKNLCMFWACIFIGVINENVNCSNSVRDS